MSDSAITLSKDHFSQVNTVRLFLPVRGGEGGIDLVGMAFWAGPDRAFRNPQLKVRILMKAAIGLLEIVFIRKIILRSLRCRRSYWEKEMA